MPSKGTWACGSTSCSWAACPTPPTRGKGWGRAIHELVDDHLGNTYRAVYVVRLGDAVHVLHAFQKKSKTGIATPKPEISLIERRLKQVLASYTSNRSKP